MKRRWSNNGGFALRMLEESSSEVTSSSAGLIMSPSIALSPNSLGSPEYGELDLWGYEDNPMHSSHGNGNGNHHSGLAGVATNLNGMHNLHHGTGTPNAGLQNTNNHPIHGLGHGNSNHHGTASFNRLTQGMVNELLAANGGNGLNIAVDLIGGNGNGLINNANLLGSSRSSTSPSIGK